ncbi:MAG: hypothetical protein U5L45_11990 [Saprospiraceae bacterium]|nr:hypothetical protein [Saprospiraceae bacterium]
MTILAVGREKIYEILRPFDEPSLKLSENPARFARAMNERWFVFRTFP